MADRIEGPYGEAVQVPVPDGLATPQVEAHICTWLITAPRYHPMWSQYLMMVISTRDVEGLPTAHRKFDGATHEMLLVVLDPRQGPYDIEKIQSYQATSGLPFLVPVNIAEQFEASDEEMAELAELACQGVVNGALNPETGDAPEAVREAWLASLTRTLAHMRGEVHAP